MPCLMSAATALLTLAHACCGYHGEPSAATTFHRTRMPPGSPATSSRSSAASTRRRTPPLPSTSHPRLLLRRAVQIKLRAGAADLICTSNSICHRHREQHRSTSAPPHGSWPPIVCPQARTGLATSVPISVQLQVVNLCFLTELQSKL
jgi:hypothetical protein